MVDKQPLSELHQSYVVSFVVEYQMSDLHTPVRQPQIRLHILHRRSRAYGAERKSSSAFDSQPKTKRRLASSMQQDSFAENGAGQ